MDLRQRVFESNDNAVENGYEIDVWPAWKIAEDISEYDAELESFTHAELLPHITAWLNQRPLRFYCDEMRHLVCKPYTVENLHRMAADLDIKRCWYHTGRHPHYDIPKKRVTELTTRCELVDPRQILAITNGEW